VHARIRHDRLLAPLFVLIGRLLQGFSAGMELGGVSVYLSEIATPGHKGFYVQLAIREPTSSRHVRSAGWSRAECQAPAGENDSMGWRVPLLLGCVINPVPLQAEAFPSRKRMSSSLASTSQVASENSPLAHGQLVDRGYRNDDGDDDHGFLLHDHRIYAHLW